MHFLLPVVPQTSRNESCWSIFSHVSSVYCLTIMKVKEMKILAGKTCALISFLTSWPCPVHHLQIGRSDPRVSSYATFMLRNSKMGQAGADLTTSLLG